MTPFPESESMTIKRLEVALKKNDMALLKDGAYKLHEKFHTGHRFEFLQELNHILNYVENKETIPRDIKDMLISTIEEIFNNSPVSKRNNLQEEQSSGNKDVKDEDIKLQGEAWENYLAQTQEASEEEFDLRTLSEQTNNFEEASQAPKVEEKEQDYPADLMAPPLFVEENNEDIPLPPVLAPKLQPQAKTEPVLTVPEASSTLPPVLQKEQPVENLNKAGLDDVVLFYDDKSQDINYNMIRDYRAALDAYFAKNDNTAGTRLLDEISAVNNFVNVTAGDLDKILSMLSSAKNCASFVTASQSEEITKILADKEIDFEIPFVKKSEADKKDIITFIPLLGLSNIFICSNCNQRIIKNNAGARALAIQCPYCDSAAFPDIHSINSYNPDCNPVFWYRAMTVFMKSKIWILVNPPLDENKEVIVDFIKTASMCCEPKRIYLLSKENDKREFYRQMLSKNIKNCEIRANYLNQEQLCEDYIKIEIAGKVFV